MSGFHVDVTLGPVSVSAPGTFVVGTDDESNRRQGDGLLTKGGTSESQPQVAAAQWLHSMFAR